jgi:subtilase family serine protease
MPHITRVLFPLLMACVLLTACSQSAQGEVANNTPTPRYVPASPTPLPSPTSEDKCPTVLQKIGTCLTPHALRVAYGLESLHQQGFTGKGQTVVTVVSFGSPTLREDMEVFDKTYNLPTVDLEIVSPLTDVPEQDPHHDKAGWGLETTLDVQMIHAIAPEAKIVVLTSPVAEIEGTTGLPEFRKLQQYILDHQLGSIVSQSWGASEISLDTSEGKQELQLWDTLYQQGATQHNITYLSASGDQGATDYANDNLKLANERTTTFAAGSPWVTSVGGTTLKRSGNTLSETAWNGSGGGFSRFYSMPSYQKTLPTKVQQQFNNQRGVPDIAATADPSTGLSIYYNGHWNMIGGTSASTPLWSGIMAVANQMAKRPLGFINPALYKLSLDERHPLYFRDIVQGNNTNHTAGVEGYSAVAGWDPITGLGAPNAEQLLPALIELTK